MAKKKDNIGLSMSIDVADLKAGIKDVKDEITQANKNFALATAGMDSWSKSSEGLEAKLTQLNSKLSSQEKAVELYKEAIEEASKKEGDHSAEIKNLESKLQDAEIAVKKTEKEIRNYSSSLEDVKKQEKESESALGKLNKTISEQENRLTGLQDEYKSATIEYGKNSKEAKELKNQIDSLSNELEDNKNKVNDTDDSLETLDKQFDDTGDGANDFSGKLEGLKNVGAKAIAGFAAVGAAVGAIGASFLATAEETREYRTNMGKLETGFETSGLKAEQAAETYKNLFAVVADEGKATEAAAMIGQLSTSQEDLNKWVNISTGVYATFGDSLPIEALAEAALETSKTGQITGGLADALNWAGVSEEGFQKALDSCTTEQERQQLITETLNKTYDEASQKYQQVNGDIMDANRVQAELADTMAEFGAIAEPIMTTLKSLANDFLQSLTPLVSVLGEGMVGALNGSADASSKLSEGLGGIIHEVISKITDLLPTVLDIIVQLIPSIINTLLAQAPSLLQLIIDTVLMLVNTLTTLIPQVIDTIMGFVPQLITSLTVAIPQIVEAFTTMFPILVQSILDAIPVLLDAAIDLFMSLVEAIPTVINTLVNVLPTIITSIVNTLLSRISTVLEGAIKLLMAIVTAIPEVIKALVPVIPQIVDAVINTLVENIPVLLEGAVQLFMALVDAIPVVIVELVKAVPQIITSIVTGIKDGISKIKEVGPEIVDGLWNGIKGKLSDLGEKAKQIGGKILGGIKSALGIASPSKEAKKLGEFFDEGLVQGLEKGEKNIEKEAGKLGETALDATKGTVDEMKDYFKNLALEVEIDANVNMDKLKEDIDKLREEAANKFQQIANSIGKVFSDITNVINSHIKNQINAIDAENKAFQKAKTAELETQQALYDQGIINEIEFATVKKQIENEKEVAEQEALKKKDEISRKQFNAQKANDIAQAIAKGAIEIVKNAGNPILAGIAAATTTAQVAVISKQQYVPMLAKGGIVNSPTLAMIGEAGKEAVMPLENNLGWISELAEKISTIMQKDFSIGMNQPQYAYAGQQVVNHYNNFNQTINSPKQLSRREIYRDSKNLLALKGV